VRRIGEAAVSESIGLQQVAELVVDSGDGNVEERQRQNTDSNYEEENDKDRCVLARGETGEGALDSIECVSGDAGKKKREQSHDGGNVKLRGEDVDGSESYGV
jgi:hypothetical protein